MTTYSTIPGTDIDTDSPVTESLMTKLRDNPIAITEGATGAPKVQTAGITDLAVTAAKVADATLTGAKMAADTVTILREISTPASDVNLTGATGGTVIPAGLYNLGRNTSASSGVRVEVYGGSLSGWQLLQAPTNPILASGNANIQICSDGVSVRLVGTTSTVTVQARKVLG